MALILVIDDSSITRKAVCRTVREGGHESLQASDGREGFEMAISRKPDCIVLDLIMPEFDGFEVLKALNKQDSKIPVIVLSADIQKIVQEECLELGAKAFINKPLITDNLNNVIKRVLAPSKENANGHDTRSD